MQIIYKKVSELKPYERNPRKNDAAVKYVAESIKQFGFKVPIVIDSNNVIIAGHTRWKAAKYLNLEEVPCVIADDLNEQQVKAFRLADNRVAEFSEWDFDTLDEELKDLEDEFNLVDLGLRDLLKDDFEEKRNNSDDDFDVDKNLSEEVISEIGDIYILGNHKLMCADNTKEENLEKLFNGEKVDLVFTDPPYRMEAQGGSAQWVGRAAAKKGEEIKELCNFDTTEFLKILPTLFEHNSINTYIFCNKDLVPDYLNWAIKNNFSFNILFWKKPNALPLGEQHRPDVEYLIFIRKNATWNNGLEGVIYSKCLEFNREQGHHPTMKPVPLVANEILISSNKNDKICDLFGGSGTTLIAAEQTNRKCFMMELNPRYVDLTVRRYIHYMGSSENCYLIRDGKKIPIPIKLENILF